MNTKFWNGRLYVAVPPRCETPWSVVMRRLEQARTFKVASVVRAPPRRCAPAGPPTVVHAVPASTPRPRERGARVVAASGRDGSGERDDGSGGNDDGSGSDGPPPPGRVPSINGRRP